MRKQIACSLAMFGLVFAAAAGDLSWSTDLEAAKKKAKDENKMVLMNFTGSDWCGWCKKLKAEVFDAKEFAEYADKNLVLVELDYPAKKEQSDELKKANADLKDKYKARGFPTIVLLNSKGEEIWKQPGYLKGGPSTFIGKIEEARKK